MREPLDPFVDALEEMAPIISYHETEYGWRGITSQGEVFEVKGSNDHKLTVPTEITVSWQGRPIGKRQVRHDVDVNIDDYLFHFNRAVEDYKAGRLTAALMECDVTDSICPTLRSKFNRSMILLAADRWHEGLREYWECEQHQPFMRPQVKNALANGMKPWMGEPLEGKKLQVFHAHGFGDTIMALRYLPKLEAMGINVGLDVPFELQRLVRCSPHADYDYFCPILHLLYFLGVTPKNVDGRPYLHIDHNDYGWSGKKVGIAWSIGKPSDGDYPRQIPLRQLVMALRDANLYSVQIQDKEEAESLGVKVFNFGDFYDCADLMMNMDEIVSVDTAALHLAGAIGHPRVTGLLSHWASWRWQAKWYDNVTLLRQTSTGDWSSALCQLGSR